jgi:tetratricopeptide (TPR) repeat protein
MPAAGPEAEAVALFQAGKYPEAETAFRAILAKNPRQSHALHALGVIAMQSPERLEEAVEWLRRANKAEPGGFAILYNLGSALRRAGQLPEALTAFRRATSLNMRSAEAHLGLGNTLRDMGDLKRARESLGTALKINASLTAARYNLALVDLAEGNVDAAESSLRQVVEREPRNADAWNHLGLIAHRREKIDEAMALYARAVEANPAFAPALANWGNAYKDLGDLDRAMSLYDRALDADPQATGALVNAASIALERGDLDAARRTASRALEVRPVLAEAQYVLGLVQLREHDFERGWEGYERRFETDPPIASVMPPHRPRLVEGLSRAKRLAVRLEQGIGDQILYSTLLPELAEQRVETIVEIDARLVDLYRRSLPQLEFVEPGAAALISTDHEVPIGSLPSFLRRTTASFDWQPRALLGADPARVAHAARVLGNGRHIAIAWRSFQAFGRRHIGERKSIPLECFAALGREGTRLVDLQYGNVADERAAFDERHPGLRVDIPGLDRRQDLEGVMAAISACDLVVTSSNVTAHFAGALGKRTWLVYLAANAPFHYWVPRTDMRSLWYPSVEIVTDARWTRWEQAFEAIAGRLAADSGGA